MTGRPALAKRHQEHYRTCNCLGDSSECCVPDCECHAPAARTRGIFDEQRREQRIGDADVLMDETDDLVTEIDFLVGEFRRLAGVVDDGTAAATIVWDVLLHYSESQP